ncbi:MATE family efflux transporter [Candidatus Margulisiibacteriota bacterium]
MNSRGENHKALGTEKISKLLLRLSAPAALGMFVNGLYNIVDTIFLGHGVGYLAIGGLAIAFPIQITVLAIGLMIGQGAASIVSRALGRKNFEKADITAGNALLLAAFFGIAVALLGKFFIDPLLIAFGATKTLMPYARDYLSIVLYGSAFFASTVCANNLVRAEGNAKTAMTAMIIGAGMNIVLDPIFIFGFGLGIKGAAIATVLSQLFGFTYLLSYLATGKSSFEFKLHHFKIKTKVIKEIFFIGMAPLFRSLGIIIMIIVVNNSLRFYGDDLSISIFGLIMRALMFVQMPMIGLLQGFMPIVGYNFGAHNLGRVKQVLKLALSAISLYCVVFSALILLFPTVILKVFSSDPELIAQGTLPLRLIVAAFSFVGLQIIGAGFFQALGKALPAMLLTMSRQILLLVPLILILPIYFGILGIWLAFPLTDILTVSLTWILLFIELKRIKLLKA